MTREYIKLRIGFEIHFFNGVLSSMNDMHDNEGKSLEEAIKCWKYKKSLSGHNRYEKSDLKVLS